MREKMMCVEREEQITASKRPGPPAPFLSALRSEGRRENEPVAVCR